MDWLPGRADSAEESMMVYAEVPAVLAVSELVDGSSKIVRCAIPKTIITAARTKATMARTKRTYHPSVLPDGRCRACPHHCRVRRQQTRVSTILRPPER